MLTDCAQLHICRLGTVREVGIAVPELLGEIECAPVGDLPAAKRSIPREPLHHRFRACQDTFMVAPPLTLTAVE